MPKFKALVSFTSESKGRIEEGEVVELTMKQADAIDNHTQTHYGYSVIERVETGKK